MIKLDKQKIIAVLSVAALAGAGYAGWQKYRRAEVHVAAPQPVAHKASDTLHFDVNAPQLTFIQIKAVEAFPEPLVEPLSARIVYDDNRTARVFSPINGRVVKILAETGTRVAAGDGVLALDAPDYAQAAADSSKAEADLLRKLEAYDRAKLLYIAKGMARKDMESAEDDWQQAKAEAERARARLNNLSRHSGKAGELYVLRAPIDGVISERQVNAGSEVRSDAGNPLFVITDPAHVWANVDLPEQAIDKVKVGQAVIAQVDAYPNESFMGKVAVIGGTMDTFTRRIQVRCELDNPQLKLKPEMYARVSPIADEHSSLPRIPNTALFTQGLYSHVFVEMSPGVLQRRRVTLALQGHERSYVKEGLKAGDRVVTGGALLLNAELSGND
ncbi:MAG: efflux RND transporter periplasmic adaptor subunit [Gallionellaceae bacterium]|nr:MAG: efflux RND transporter periplasmic adaptor subunit [Gallionellaceae bacterium]